VSAAASHAERADALERLRAAAPASGGPLPDGVPERVVAYLEEVLRAGRDLNLTAAETLAEAVDVLGLSSLAVRAAWPADREPPRRVVDLGTGNGFPGVVAALLWPGARVLLVERRAKKAAAVAACCARAGVANAEAVPCDGRELLRERPEVREGVDLVTARAVGTLEETIRIAAPWLVPGGVVAQWKGVNLTEDERSAGSLAAARAGLGALRERRFPVPPGPACLVLCSRPARPARRRAR
jgi:16S rRNA (guanine527-N7)-methyltransferase